MMGANSIVVHSRFGESRFSNALLIFLFASLGCRNSQEPSTTQDAVPSAAFASTRDEFEVDCGTVFAGEEVIGRFAIKNDSSEAITICDEMDITTNCGCSGISTQNKSIGPGLSEIVTVKVGTAGRSGKFSAGGQIVWKSRSGMSRTTRFKVSCTIRCPMHVEPDHLSFDEDDINRRRTRELRVRSLVALDWDKLQIVGESSSLRIGKLRRDGDSVIVPVTCEMGVGVELVDSAITMDAPIVDPRSPLVGKNSSLRIPATGRRRVEFAVSPTTILVTHTRGLTIAKLVVFGSRLVAGSQVIRAVDCDIGGVEWTVSKPSSAGVAMMELRFQTNQGKATMVKIEVVGLEPIRLPVVWPETTLPKTTE